MWIELHDRTRITLLPRTRDELIDILKIKNIGPESDAFYDHVARFTQGAEVRIEQAASESATKGGGGWARVSGVTDALAPYWETLDKKLGSKPFDVDLMPGLHFGHIRHTYYVEELRSVADTGLVHYTLVSCIYPRQGQTFPDDHYLQTRAALEIANDVASIFGTAIPIPEFIDMGNGLFKRNPKYPGNGDTRYTPDIGDDVMLLHLANQWLERFATPAQRETVKRVHCSDRAGKVWFHNYDKGRDAGFHLDACRDFISYEDFKKL
jgi:hypothetical protein